MYSDRELLGLAAKAAGYDVRFELDSGGDYVPRVVSRIYIQGLRDGEWNPLTDDGDALRLAGEIGLVVCMMHNAGFTGVYLPACRIGGKYDEVELHGKDQFSATRRAIVRAAASIGEAMQ